MTLGQMAARLRVTIAALRTEAEEGRIPSVRIGDRLFCPEAVVASLAERASRMEAAR